VVVEVMAVRRFKKEKPWVIPDVEAFTLLSTSSKQELRYELRIPCLDHLVFIRAVTAVDEL